MDSHKRIENSPIFISQRVVRVVLHFTHIHIINNNVLDSIIQNVPKKNHCDNFFINMNCKTFYFELTMLKGWD